MLMQSQSRVVQLPTLHADQAKAYNVPARFKAVRCGRRWGKTTMGITIATNGATKRKRIGWFAPEYKYLNETYEDIRNILLPIASDAHKNVGTIRTAAKPGAIDFWALDRDDRAGRGRHYDIVIIDEGAFTKPNMIDIWEKSIKPTLFDTSGSAIVLSNCKGVDPDNFFWKICNEAQYGFVEYHAPTNQNPLLPMPLPGEPHADWLLRRAIELDKLKTENHPLVYSQEYLAEFVDWAGVAFFSKDKLLADLGNGRLEPLPDAERCDTVYAVIDTAVKDGQEHDSTAVIYFGLVQNDPVPLRILDWDVIQIEGALLETWLPTVFQNLEALAQQTHARMGHVGAYIEDKTSGTILIQQAIRRHWPAQAISSHLTEAGKDARAISVSGYVYRGMCKFTQAAYDKVKMHKMVSANHCLRQITRFRVGDAEAHKRADDLLDCFCYGVAIGLGNAEGY